MPKKPKRIKRRKQQVPELSDQLVRFAVNEILAAFGSGGMTGYATLIAIATFAFFLLLLLTACQLRPLWG